ncbi:MAG: hypothetical protein K8H88_08200, partial [Sandaracinaceae bacterium]|nr:hypothetical protein [Sandaracinaceae bacterium]
MTRTTRRRLRAALAFLVLVVAVAMAASAVALDVTGRVDVPEGYGAPPAAEREGRSRDYYWEEWNGFLEPRPRRFS